MDNETTNKQSRPHAELIKAWADGSEIQYFDGTSWRDEKHPSWEEDVEYRIRPEGEPWQPDYKEAYFIVDENFEASEEIWDDCDFDFTQRERGNCFKTFEEAEAAAERVIAAFRGEESEEMKKLRQENEELKLRLKQAQECSSLSDGETALIQALRKGEIIKVFYGDICQVIVEVSSEDAVYDALEKIQAEQKESNG